MIYTYNEEDGIEMRGRARLIGCMSSRICKHCGEQSCEALGEAIVGVFNGYDFIAKNKDFELCDGDVFLISDKFDEHKKKLKA